MRLRRPKANPEAKKALENATEHLERIKARGPEVSRVATAIRTMRERNHFIEQLQPFVEGPK